MRNILLTGLAGVALIVATALYLSLFVVNQTQQAIVLQFGDYIRTVRDPGLHMKVPLLQQVVIYDNRILDLNPPIGEIILGDSKPLVVDAYLRYRIEDPLKFYQANRSQVAAEARISDIVDSTVRRVLATVELPSVLSAERVRLMNDMRTAVGQETRAMGVSVTDLRIRRADLPPATSKQVFDRMKEERNREVEELRSQGDEMALQIQAAAERERQVLLAEGHQISEQLRGEGDAKAIAIYNEAFGVDPAFFEFYRTMEGYKAGLDGKNTSMILSPDHPFLSYFRTFNVESAGSVVRR